VNEIREVKTEISGLNNTLEETNKMLFCIYQEMKRGNDIRDTLRLPLSLELAPSTPATPLILHQINRCPCFLID